MAQDHGDRRISKETPFHRDDIESDLVESPLENGKSGKPSLDYLNEHSPLLTPQREEDDDSPLPSGTPADLLDYNEGEEEVSKSHWYLFLLALSIGG